MIPAVLIPIIIDLSTSQAMTQIARSGAVATMTYTTEIALYTTKAYNYMFHRNTYFYTMKIGNDVKGFGVTKNLSQRVNTHKRNCIKAGTQCELIDAKLHTKERAYEIERSMKKRNDIVNTGIPGFKTEAVPIERNWYYDIVKYWSQ